MVGATKSNHVAGAAKATELTLTPEELSYLEELYVPHNLAGVMAQNSPAAARQKPVLNLIRTKQIKEIKKDLAVYMVLSVSQSYFTPVEAIRILCYNQIIIQWKRCPFLRK